MEIFRSFSAKELLEIRTNKKLWLYCCALVVFPLVINLIARNPIVPLEYAMTILLIAAASCTGEFVFLSMVEELHYNTLGVLLVSPINKKYLLFYKASIPFAICFLCGLTGLIINDLLISVIPSLSEFQRVLSGQNILYILFAAMISAAIEFCLVVKDQKADAKKHTLTLLLSILICGPLALLGTIYNILFFLFPAILVLVLTFYMSANILKWNMIKIRVKKQYVDLFQGRDITMSKALVIKSIQWIRAWTFFELALLLAAAMINGNKPLFYYFFLFLLSSFGARRVLLPLLINDTNNHIIEIILLVCKKVPYYIFSGIGSLSISLLFAGILAVSLRHAIMVDLILVALTAVASCFYACLVHRFLIKRPRDSAIGSLVLSALSLVTYLGLWLLLPFF